MGETVDVDPLALRRAWELCGQEEPALHRRLERVTRMLLVREGEANLSPHHERRLALRYVDALGDQLVRVGLLSERERARALRHEALVLVAQRVARTEHEISEVVEMLAQAPGFASRLSVQASELLSGSFPSALELTLLKEAAVRA